MSPTRQERQLELTGTNSPRHQHAMDAGIIVGQERQDIETISVTKIQVDEGDVDLYLRVLEMPNGIQRRCCRDHLYTEGVKVSLEGAMDLW